MIFTKTILEVLIPIGADIASVHYSNTNHVDNDLNKLKIITFLLYTVRMIWNSDSDYKPMRLQIRTILENPPQKGKDFALPITFASLYTENRSMKLVDKVENPIITFSGKLIKNTDSSFFVYTKLGSLLQHNLGAQHTPTSTFIFWQNLMDTLSEKDNNKIMFGLKNILDYFDSVQDKKWSVNIMNDAVVMVNKLIT